MLRVSVAMATGGGWLPWQPVWGGLIKVHCSSYNELHDAFAEIWLKYDYFC